MKFQKITNVVFGIQNFILDLKTLLTVKVSVIHVFLLILEQYTL